MQKYMFQYLNQKFANNAQMPGVNKIFYDVHVQKCIMRYVHMLLLLLHMVYSKAVNHRYLSNNQNGRPGVRCQKGPHTCVLYLLHTS